MDEILTLGLMLALFVMASAAFAHFTLRANRYWLMALTGVSEQVRLSRPQRRVVAYSLYLTTMMLMAVFGVVVAIVFYVMAGQVNSDELRTVAQLFGFVWAVLALSNVAGVIKGLRFLLKDIAAEAATAP